MSTFSGVGGFEMALAGHECIGWSEVDPYASSVYRYHFPHHPEYGDITKIDAASLPDFDLLVGGFPCQDLSVAGKRAGLAGKRSGLFYHVVRILEAKQPEWFILENVAGLLSSNGGRDMGAVLGALVDCGYGVAWRVLDSRFAGVPQRRRRIFLVGHLGDECAGDVLALNESLRGDSPASAQAGEVVAALTSNGVGVSGADDNQASAGHLVPLFNETGHERWVAEHVAGTLTAHASKDAHSLVLPILEAGARTGVSTNDPRAGAEEASEQGTSSATPIMAFSCKDYGGDAGDTAPTLRSMNFADSHLNGGGQVAVAFAENQRAEVLTSDTTGALKTGGGKPGQGYPAVMVQTTTCNHSINAESSSERSRQEVPAMRETADAQVVPEQQQVGVPERLQETPVLQYAVREGVHAASVDESSVDGLSPAGSDSVRGEKRNVRDVPTSQGDGDSPQERGLAGQQAGKPDGGLSVMSPTGASPTAAMFGCQLCAEEEAQRPVREAFTTGGEVGQSAGRETEPARRTTVVRRLTPLEAERLMSWPDQHTAAGRKPDGTIVPISDSRRYRMCGNGVVSAVVRQIVERIERAA